MNSRAGKASIRIFVFLFCSFLLSAQKSFAAITVAFDAKSSASNNNVSSLTFSHTTGTGSDRILIVGVSVEGVNVNSVTYNGAALTRLATRTNTVKVEMWYRIAPAAGAHNVVITLSANCGIEGVIGGAQSFFNVDQVSPFGTTVTASGNSSTASAVVSSAANEMVVDAVASGFFDLTSGAGQTQDYNRSPFIRGGGSREAGGASVTMSWTIDLSDDWAIIAAPIQPAAVLPVKLCSFDAECRNNNVAVSWTTASEANNNYFTLEKSADGVYFETVAVVPGSGNSSTQRNYEVVDTHPLNGVSYYRLQQTDHNGGYEYFQSIAVQNCSGVNPELQFYFHYGSGISPSKLVYHLPQAGYVKIKIYNTLGQLVTEQETLQQTAGVHYYSPFPNEADDTPQNYIALLQYRNRMIPCRFIR